MSDNTAPEQPPAVVGETNVHSVSFAGKLDDGEQLTGTPTVVDEAGKLTLANKVVNTVALVINDQDVAIGQAVQFTATGYTVANSPYTIKITCGTDGTPAQTKIGRTIIRVEA
jgi:hypothetical protein